MAEGSARNRVQRMRARRERAGFKRVEVYIPEDQVDALKAYAAKLREGSESEVTAEARRLVARAYEKYRARCLDNISVDPETADLADAAVVATALMERGDAEAYRLGRRLKDLTR